MLELAHPQEIHLAVRRIEAEGIPVVRANFAEDASSIVIAAPAPAPSTGNSNALFKPTGPGVNPTAPLDPRSRGSRTSMHGQTRRLEAQPDTSRAARTAARPGSHGS
jgi:hypothetical protein